MPQSLSKVYLHCVFSTKHRQNFITETLQKNLHAYIVGTLSKLGSYVNEINSHKDHIHILCSLPRTICISDLISKIKTSSSKWAKTQGEPNFSWQNGYGAFSVSASKLVVVEKYILNQANHHAKKPFKEEYRLFLEEYELEYDEKHVWD